ncbi:MAG: methyl-accepting chemotaxis protein [Gammaproteobacteria bacterium]|nr:methyl-accepting chemotaxis protein [Gammaproteobacteria bacterium]
MLSVKKKLVLLVAATVVGIAALMIISRVESGRVYTSASYARDHTVPAINLLDGVTNLVESERANFWQSLVQTDAAQTATFIGEIHDARPNIDAAFGQYESLGGDEKDRALLADDRAASKAYDDLIDKALEMAGQNRKTEARDLVMRGQDIFDATIDTVEAHRRYNKDLGDAAATEGLRLKALAFRVEVAVGVFTTALLLVVAFVVIRSITRALAHSVAVLGEIERGNYESPVTILVHDETGQVLKSLEAMQRSLKERTERDRERAESDRLRAEGDRTAAAENARIRNALDRVSVAAMLADAGGVIIYVNDAMQDLLRIRAGEFGSQLPQFDPDGILGSPLEVFQVSTFESGSLARLTTAQTAEFKAGHATLRVVANPVVDAAGERVGTIVQWFDRTQEVAIEEEVQRTVEQALEGNLTVRIQEDGKEGFFKALAGGMNRLVGNMADVLRTISKAAGEVGAGANEISRGNADLSKRTEEQASSLEETASSMEQMTSAVKSNADNAAQASQLALAAREQADRGGAVVQSAVTAMNEINASSSKIADIIGVIDDIAFQTNLLALNAAVEAARAGEQGRGFAVVASEVRSLASRSAAAAKEIKGLIQDSVAKVEDGTKLVGASGSVLQEIVAGVKKVTDVVAEIAASSQEQASGIEQVNKAVMSMDEVTQQNAALVEEASAAAQALSEQASNLGQLIARYQVGEVAGTTPARKSSTSERRAAERPWANAVKRPVSAASRA